MIVLLQVLPPVAYDNFPVSSWATKLAHAAQVCPAAIAHEALSGKVIHVPDLSASLNSTSSWHAASTHSRDLT